MILSTLPARLAWAAYLRRRVPARVLNARLAARNPGRRFSRVVVSNARSSYRACLLVGVAPGERTGLVDLIDSLRRCEGDDIKVVVADDLTGEYPDRVVQREFPGIDFVRPAIPAGTGLCPFHTLQPALIHVVQRYRPSAVLKCDPDTVVIGSGAFDRAIERFRAEPMLGMLGRTVFDAHPVDPRWVIWMAHPELRWNRSFRRLVRAAATAVPRLDFAQGGAHFISSRAVASALERGLLPYRQPQWSLQGADVLTGLVIQAAGFTVETFGPHSPIATDTDRLPLEPTDLLEQGAKVVHSVRASPSGMGEQAIRALFAAARAGG